jgi:hypothetical protein
MPVNPYFDHSTFTTEQDLIEDLVIEAIQIYGHEAYYVPREDVNIDRLLGEDGLSQYEHAFPIEIYLSTFDSFAGQSEFISKFGLHIEDQAKFIISAKRFFQETNHSLPRPRENDLIYIQFTPDNRYVFEIRFVENKEKLFQLGKLYTYELRCEMMNYSHERVQTAVPELNEQVRHNAYQILIELDSGTGTFLQGETVYQGASFMTAVATGTVHDHDISSKTLYLADITGIFNATDSIIGITSGANYIPIATAETTPGVADEINATENMPVGDNKQLKTEKADIIVRRGTNPITGQ